MDQQSILVPEEILQNMFGNDTHRLELLSMSRFGCSGPPVVFLRNGGPGSMALKYGKTRVPISTQIKNRELLVNHLAHRLPKVLNSINYPDGQAMLMEAIEGPNFHEAVMLGSLTDEHILGIVDRIFGDFQKMWLATKSNQPFSETRRPAERLKRVTRAALKSLKALDISPSNRLVVNGKDLGVVMNLLDRLKKYRSPKFSVLCHSDLNADNFVITPSGEDYYLVDWEWVGRHDWRLSVSHFFGWWTSNATRLKTEPRVEKKGNRVEFSYELVMPPVCRAIQDRCRKLANQTARLLGDEKWPNGFDLLVAALLLGDVRFVDRRNRGEYVIPLLGEGLRMLAKN